MDSLYDFYDLISFPVAKNKTRTTIGDIKQSEFLRVQTERGLVRSTRAGYPCRAISSLVYMKPWSSNTNKADYNDTFADPNTPDALIGNWCKYRRRNLTPNIYLDFLMLEIV